MISYLVRRRIACASAEVARAVPSSAVPVAVPVAVYCPAVRSAAVMAWLRGAHEGGAGGELFVRAAHRGGVAAQPHRGDRTLPGVDDLVPDLDRFADLRARPCAGAVGLHHQGELRVHQVAVGAVHVVADDPRPDGGEEPDQDRAGADQQRPEQGRAGGCFPFPGVVGVGGVVTERPPGGTDDQGGEAAEQRVEHQAAVEVLEVADVAEVHQARPPLSSLMSSQM